MQKNTSITFGKHFDNFVAKQIQDGRYASASEAIRSGLRLLEERELKISSLQQALIEGETSGTADYSLKKTDRRT